MTKVRISLMRGNCVVEPMVECSEYDELENSPRNDQFTIEEIYNEEKKKRDLGRSWGSWTFSSREGNSEASGHCWPEDREMLSISPVIGTNYFLYGLSCLLHQLELILPEWQSILPKGILVGFAVYLLLLFRVVLYSLGLGVSAFPSEVSTR